MPCEIDDGQTTKSRKMAGRVEETHTSRQKKARSKNHSESQERTSKQVPSSEGLVRPKNSKSLEIKAVCLYKLSHYQPALNKCLITE